MRNLREAIEIYPYIALDTEFPGVVARPIGSFKTSSDYHYQTMRCNVDLLRIIQVGLTLVDEDGNSPGDVCTWQFNFRFSLSEDMFAPDSIELLQKSGLDFQRHEEMGIDPDEFAALLITSGLVLTDEAKWIGFHSGYDFGYLVKLLTASSLPTNENDFFDALNTWFPISFDVKYIMKASKVLKGGLQDVADDLGVMRIGPSHQAGSDSLLTASIFFKMREQYFEDQIPEKDYSGLLYGLGGTYTNGETGSGRAGVTLAEPEKDTVSNSMSTGSASGTYLNSMAAPFTTMHNNYGR